VTRALQLGVLAAAAVTALALTATAGGARECNGLQVCVPVVGPWVLVPPSQGTSRDSAEWHLSCPRRYVVGGLDAELSRRPIDLAFLGLLGAPVNPGISTERAVTFVGTWVGAQPLPSSFKPYIGCMPSAGGGVRIPTAVSAFPPGRPMTRRVKLVRVRPGTTTVRQGCRAGERLVGARHAFGFFTRTPPSDSLARGVSGTRTVSGGRVVVRVRGDAELGGVRAVVQVQALCAGAA
jgi:hypothetical protein